MPSILKNNKSIYFKEDIVKELSTELNISEKELNEIINLNLKYIKESVTEKPILIISLPNLAKLRFNLKLGMSSTYTNAETTSVSGQKKLKSLNEKIEILKNYKEPKFLSFNKPLFERLYKKITRYSKAYQIYDNMYTMWSIIEKKSNEILQNIK